MNIRPSPKLIRPLAAVCSLLAMTALAVIVSGVSGAHRAGAAGQVRPLQCTSQGTPTVRGSGADVVEIFYLYGCDQAPAAVGVVDITEYMVVEKPNGAVVDTVPVDRLQKQSAATEMDACSVHACDFHKAIGLGLFRPVLELRITGNFTYGSVPGCWRDDPRVVRCRWVGPVFNLT
jgi:hypothetical protein